MALGQRLEHALFAREAISSKCGRVLGEARCRTDTFVLAVVEQDVADLRDPMDILQEVKESILEQEGKCPKRRSVVAKTPEVVNLGKISVGRLRVKMSGRPDSDGDINILGTVPVDNLTNSMLNVTLSFQGLDADGFEIETLDLVGIVLAGARAHSLAGQTSWIKATRYNTIVKWQLASFYEFER